MKKIGIILVLVLASSFLFAQNAEQYYKSKSGKVSYKFELSGTHVDYTLTFDNHGEQQSFYTKSMVDGVEVVTKTIVTKDFIYVINYSDKQVIKFPLDIKENNMGSEMGGGIDVAAIVNDVSGKEHLKKGSEELLGRTCDVYAISEEEGGKGKYWIWNNFLLKAEFVDNEGNHTYMEATQFDPGVNIPASEFEIPEGYEITDMSEMMKKMQGVPTEE